MILKITALEYQHDLLSYIIKLFKRSIKNILVRIYLSLLYDKFEEKTSTKSKKINMF